MRKIFFVLLVVNMFYARVYSQEVLIVADEIPAMQVLANALKKNENLDAKIVTQSQMPASLTDFRAVVVYIHQDLDPDPEKAFIEYTRNGGRLICLHHSISSKKRKNASWFTFLDLDLPPGDVEAGGYKFVGNIDLGVLNLAPRHFIMTNKMHYDTSFAFTRENKNKQVNRKGFMLKNTEAFLNHNLHVNPSRKILMGMKMRDKAGKEWMQSRSAWYMPSGKGWVFYSQPGHAVSDFENANYARIVTNMIVFTTPASAKDKL
ncbi:hypothetical protein GCM10010967_24030 [Dyadobacter beijingensis]|uniref:ThuA-like domain-containing protein n=1 Tax=Dyadobacter beijingensis TaxID=365489 RepID=A0ABQ2HUD5_9BACT|nr:ThuA domain-containing protein [Dyadobacter beijingensis]GGM90292.1 hypothetical protein GCM10010967_24030 [Dyadobacter beijingensis]